GTGTPARSPGRPKEATRRTIAVGFFLAATFGMLVVLSMPVSHLAQLPRRLPRPLQGALSPLEPFLPPFARGGTPRLPARSPSLRARVTIPRAAGTAATAHAGAGEDLTVWIVKRIPFALPAGRIPPEAPAG